MSVLIDNTAGATVTEGTSDFVISGTVDGYKAIVGRLTDAAEYSYKAELSTDVDVFETGKGVWDSGTATLTRATVNTSSNADAKVSFAAGTKNIFIVPDAETVQSMANKTETATEKVYTGTERTKLATVQEGANVGLPEVFGGFLDPVTAIVGQDGCIDKFTGFDIDNMGLTDLLAGGVTITDFDPALGFRLNQTDNAQGWTTTTGETLPTPNNLLAASPVKRGYTLYFEMESAVFASTYDSGISDASGGRGCLMYSTTEGGGDSKGFSHYDDTANWDNWASRINGTKTLDLALDTMVGVYCVYTPGIGHDLYADKFLVAHFDDDGHNPTVISLGGLPAILVTSLSTYKRNVCLWDKPISVTRNVAQKAVNFIGDSFMQWGQYQSGNVENKTESVPTPADDPDNNPPSQYTGTVLDDAQFIAPYELKNASMSAILNSRLADKGLYPVIRNYAAGGATVGVVTNDPFGGLIGALDKRVDAALGLNGEKPAGGSAGVGKVYVCNCGTNDINFQYNPDPEIGGDAGAPDSLMDTIPAALKVQYDRLIDDGAEAIYQFNIAKRFDEFGAETLASRTAYLNTLYANEVDGYRGIVKVIDIYTDWVYSFTQGLDPGNHNHPGPTGQKQMMDKLVEAMPDYIPASKEIGANLFNEPKTAAGINFQAGIIHGQLTAYHSTPGPSPNDDEPINDTTPRIITAAWSGGSRFLGTVVDTDDGIIEVEHDGLYWVQLAISFTGTAGKDYKFNLSTDPFNGFVDPYQAIVPAATGFCAINGMMQLTAGKKVCARQSIDTGTGTLLITEGSLQAFRLGNII